MVKVGVEVAGFMRGRLNSPAWCLGMAQGMTGTFSDLPSSSRSFLLADIEAVLGVHDSARGRFS